MTYTMKENHSMLPMRVTDNTPILDAIAYLNSLLLQTKPVSNFHNMLLKKDHFIGCLT